jgi:UMF1 family MFS transporter
MRTRKNVWLWASYDFANSIISIVFFLYFSQWIVIEKGFSDLAYNLTYTYSTIALILAVPIAGLLMDTRIVRRITGVRALTVATAISYLLCAYFGITEHTLWSLVFFTVGMFAFQFSFTFYTPLINDIAHEHERGKVSGIGIGLNYIGQFVGILAVLPFANGTWSLFGASPRLETFVPATLLFLIFSLPMLLWFKEDNGNTASLVETGNRGISIDKFKEHARSIWKSTRELFTYRNVTLFFLTYFFFNDAVLTAANNFPIFLEAVWKVSDTVKSGILAGIVLTSALGGFLGGRIADYIGHKKTLTIILYGWAIILPSVGFAPTFTLFVIAVVLMGTWFGASWAVSRSVMSYLTPTGLHNLTFGYFGLVERTSSLLGPIAWGLTVGGLSELGAMKYQMATVVVSVFVVFGIIAFRRVRSDR